MPTVHPELGFPEAKPAEVPMEQHDTLLLDRLPLPAVDFCLGMGAGGCTRTACLGGSISVSTGQWRSRPRGQRPEPGPSAPRWSPCHSPAVLGSLVRAAEGWHLLPKHPGRRVPHSRAGRKLPGLQAPSPWCHPARSQPCPCMEVLLGGLKKAGRGEAAEAGRAPTAPCPAAKS